ncbi:integrin beta-1-like [Mya arenaria]|uniref:integrin beta-1-like n=1 Tax=Mya arenaria TaxID=6604 RepID=UPI0022E6859D|nr:integrin beta-1-like [Mya arenaria]
MGLYGLFSVVTCCCWCVAVSHGPTHGSSERHGDLRSSLQDLYRNTLCRGENGQPCNGHGRCLSGICACNPGRYGLKCEVNGADLADQHSMLSGFDLPRLTGFSGFTAPTTAENAEELPSQPSGDFGLGDNFGENVFPNTEPSSQNDNVRSSDNRRENNINENLACGTFNENPCNGRGLCRDGVCECQTGFSGFTCEVSHSLGFCNTYRECAECKAFIMACPNTCSNMANFKLVYDFPTMPSSFLRKCRFRSSKFSCSYYFMQETEDIMGRKTIMVRPCYNFREIVNMTTRTESPLLVTEPAEILGHTEPTPIVNLSIAPLSTTEKTTTPKPITKTTEATTTKAAPQTTDSSDEGRDGKSDQSKGGPVGVASSISLNFGLHLFGSVLVLFIFNDFL